MFRDLMGQAGEDVLRHLGENVTTDGGTVTALVDPGEEDARLRRTGSYSSDHGLATNIRQMRVVVRESDADMLPTGSLVTVRGEDYEALDARPSGYGLVEVPLVDAQPSDPDGTAWR